MKRTPLGRECGYESHIVNELFKQTGGIAPMTWDHAKNIIRKYYKEVFIIPKFDPKTYREWYQLFTKDGSHKSIFIRSYHLKKVNEQCP